MSRRKMRDYEAKQADRWAVGRRDALEHFRARRYDEGEGVLLAIDRDIQGGLAIEKCYLELLRELVASGAPEARQLEVFARGVSWARGNVPTPHTAEEAASNEWAAAEGRARFVHVLGLDPD